METPSAALADIGRARCIALTTFKRDGTAVVTPIWLNVIGDRILVTTPSGSGKVKRVRNNSRVTFARCTQRGRVVGPEFEGTAQVLPPERTAEVLRAKRRRYFSARFIQLLPSARDQVAIEITPNR